MNKWWWGLGALLLLSGLAIGLYFALRPGNTGNREVPATTRETEPPTAPLSPGPAPPKPPVNLIQPPDLEVMDRLELKGVTDVTVYPEKDTPSPTPRLVVGTPNTHEIHVVQCQPTQKLEDLYTVKSDITGETNEFGLRVQGKTVLAPLDPDQEVFVIDPLFPEPDVEVNYCAFQAFEDSPVISRGRIMHCDAPFLYLLRDVNDQPTLCVYFLTQDELEGEVWEILHIIQGDEEGLFGYDFAVNADHTRMVVLDPVMNEVRFFSRFGGLNTLWRLEQVVTDHITRPLAVGMQPNGEHVVIASDEGLTWFDWDPATTIWQPVHTTTEGRYTVQIHWCADTNAWVCLENDTLLITTATGEITGKYRCPFSTPEARFTLLGGQQAVITADDHVWWVRW